MSPVNILAPFVEIVLLRRILNVSIVETEAYVSIIVKLISTGCNTGTVLFFLLRTVSNCVSGVGYLLVSWYLVPFDPFKNVESFHITISIEESSKFVFTGLGPHFTYGFVWVFDQVSVVSHLVQFCIPDVATSGKRKAFDKCFPYLVPFSHWGVGDGV